MAQTMNFGFDYLRDNMVYEKGRKFSADLFCLLLMSDSILIDKGGSAIISGRRRRTEKLLYFADCQALERMIMIG